MQIGENKVYKFDNQKTAFWVTVDTQMDYEVREIAPYQELPNIDYFLLKKISKEDISSEPVKNVKKTVGIRRLLYCPFCHKVEDMTKYLVPKKDKISQKIVSQLNKKYENWLQFFEGCYSSKKISLDSIVEFEQYDLNDDSTDYPYMLKKNETIVRKLEVWEEEYHNSETHETRERVHYRARMICPHCGEELTHLKSRRVSHINKAENVLFHTATLFNDEDKVDVSFLCSTVYINHKVKKIAFEPFRIRLVFNTKTGQSYYLPPRQLNNKKVSWGKYARVKNITFSGSACIEYSFKSTIERMSPLIKDIFVCLIERPFAKNAVLETFLDSDYWNKGVVVDDDLYFKLTDELNFRDITIFNRMPFLPRRFLSNEGSFYSPNYTAGDIMKVLLRHVPREAEFSEIVPCIIEKNKLPNTKKMRKLLTKNYYIAERYYYFKRTAFKDINIFYSMLEDSYPIDSLTGNKDFRKKSRAFIKKLIEVKGEAGAYKALLPDVGIGYQYRSNRRNTISYVLTDSISMYNRICKYMETNENDFDITKIMRGSIREIHDAFSKIINQIRYANVPIVYKEHDEKFNQTFDEYSFTLAIDTNELISIGQNMKICVGGYRDKALERRCIIVKMEKDGKYVGCIELDGTGKKLIQAKAVCNNLLQENKALALKKWVEMLEIDAENCWDYRHIAEDNVSFNDDENYQRTHDYHHLELDENGNVV